MYLENPNVPLSGIRQLVEGEFYIGRHVCDLGALNSKHNSGFEKRLTCILKVGFRLGR